MRLVSRCFFVALSACVAGAAIADDWRQFRGPGGQGHAPARHTPVEWSETRNIVWKSAVPGLGWSSPVVAGNQIWLTTATDDGKSLRAICCRRDNGELAHDIEVFHRDATGSIHKKNSHASPTPFLEGDRVYVHFGAYGTACLSNKGEVIWKTNELKYNHMHGPGGSPIVWKDTLIVHCDGGDAQFIAALDKHSGAIRWKRDREHLSADRRAGRPNVPMSYTTPLLATIGGQTQLVSAASDYVSGLDPDSGQDIWRAHYYGYSNVALPVVGLDMVFVSSGYDDTIFHAFSTRGRGDLTGTEAWRMEKAPALDVSPILLGDELYLISNGGVASCVDARTGEMHWQKRLGGTYSASMTLAEGRLYFVNEDAQTTVIAASKEFERIAVNELEGRALATPAFVDGAIFLRTDTHLYRIGEDQ